MQEGEECGLRYIYRLVDLTALGLSNDALPALLQAGGRLGFSGFAVTHPCKEAILPHLSELSSDARLLGAVNTVVLEGGRSIGHNTDWFGFADSFRRDIAGVKADRVVQLGAGGAGKAVAHALLTCGVGRVNLWVRNQDKAKPVVDSLAAIYGADRIGVVDNLAEAVAGADGLVNATPIGMDAHPGCPLPMHLLRPDLWVTDLSTRQPRRNFLKPLVYWEPGQITVKACSFPRQLSSFACSRA
ncbi:shikimate dehydrogenase [Caballeronia telluris]|uniref:Shikimate 5-dehydrogenase n=1 Tax=Caballeronia telluris TaxID=326475 RepID=A0A158JYG8_9BURK|nr:shikimate dehydrogenase [Caballeronia telluris]SAL74004.1 shikimate 5-dehydrogenase [Caballeronia telluris]